MAEAVLFQSARLFDGYADELRDNVDVVVADGLIQEISDSRLSATGRTVVKCDGRTLMPGLIDAHVHVYASGLNITKVVGAPLSYLSQYANGFLRHILDCGFTSIRDTGAGDLGLANALRDGFLAGPRFYYGGRVISQTGGHGDFRHQEHDAYLTCCGCSHSHDDVFAVVADGVDAVRRAVREEMRRGAHHIKIMGSGGVASPTDPLERDQYSDEEIRAVVEETTRWGIYTAAHCHPTQAVRRCVELGVRSIEHGTLIDEETARFVAASESFVVPTMAVIFALVDDGLALGLPKVSYDKLLRVADHALTGLETMRNAGVRMGFGTDLLGQHHTRQGTEFTLRSRVLPAIDILRSATSVNAALLNEEGRLGCVREGALADLIVVDGDPLADIECLAVPHGGKLAAIMKDGRFHKRTI